MKILILGHGSVGRVLVNLLSDEKAIKEIVVGDINVKKEEKQGKIIFKKVNVKEGKKLIKLFDSERPDVVVNASSPIFNWNILEACHKVGLNYMDMASQWDPHPDKNAKSPYKIEQFDYENQFKENNILGLIEAGVSPGLTNLLSRECAEELDEIDHIKIRLLDYSGTDELTFFWSKEALLDEIGCKPLIYENGKFIIKEPFSDEEEFDYPLPFGMKKASLICQDEIGTIPFFIKAKKIDIKDYDNQIEIHKFLYKLGLISKKKIQIGNVKLSPFDFVCKVLPDVTLDINNKKYENAQFGLVVQASGKKNNKERMVKYSVMFPKQKDINKLNLGANFISYPTAFSAMLFIMAMPKIKSKGIIPPEALENDVREYIINELRKTKHIVFEKEVLDE
jgi:saccharopine dehydrogenase (NAD+, L-lysine-forming)